MEVVDLGVLSNSNPKSFQKNLATRPYRAQS
jgi:hypothetical protein